MLLLFFILVGLTWFQIYLLFSLLPLVFHDFSWSTIAYLRYLNVTDSDGWLEIDQEKLRSRTSILTWTITALTLALFIPFGHHLLDTTLERNEENTRYVVAEAMILLGLSLVPYMVAFWFYYRIFRYARHVMAVENTMIDDHVTSTHASPSVGRQMIRRIDSEEQEEPMEAVNVIFDDSSDDDLIEVGESQCVKQVNW